MIEPHQKKPLRHNLIALVDGIMLTKSQASLMQRRGSRRQNLFPAPGFAGRGVGSGGGRRSVQSANPTQASVDAYCRRHGFASLVSGQVIESRETVILVGFLELELLEL